MLEKSNFAMCAHGHSTSLMSPDSIDHIINAKYASHNQKICTYFL